ncbi:MAG: hypothetical protein V1824_01030 [archaeon]
MGIVKKKYGKKTDPVELPKKRFKETENQNLISFGPGEEVLVVKHGTIIKAKIKPSSSKNPYSLLIDIEYLENGELKTARVKAENITNLKHGYHIDNPMLESLSPNGYNLSIIDWEKIPENTLYIKRAEFIEDRKHRETIILNSTEDQRLKKFLDRTVRNIKSENKTEIEDILTLVQQKITEKWKRTPKDYDLTQHEFIFLGDVIDMKVCRTAAPLAKLILDQLGIQSKLVVGTMDVYKNAELKQGNHIWLEIKTPNNQTYVFDPTLEKKYGPISNLNYSKAKFRPVGETVFFTPTI